MFRGEVWKVVLDPTKGSEQQGCRNCVIVSPDSMNNALDTIIVLPLTSSRKKWPTRVNTKFNQVEGQAQCEQIRTVSKKRLKSNLGKLSFEEMSKIRLTLKQMLFE